MRQALTWIRRRPKAIAGAVVFVLFVALPVGLSKRVLAPSGPAQWRLNAADAALLSLNKAPLSLETEDHLKLHAEFLELEPSKRKGVLVLVHGWGDHRLRHMNKVRWALDQGMETLLFDHRAHGASKEVGWGTLGAIETRDVHAAVQLARKLRPGARIHAWGISMGGFLVLNEAGRYRDVDSVVSESPYWSARQIIGQYLWLFARLPYFPVGAEMAKTVELVSGVSLDEADLTPALPKLEGLPTLVVGSEGDVRMPPPHVRRIFDAIPGTTKMLWIPPTLAHGKVFTEDPLNYQARVSALWNKAGSSSSK